MSDLSTCPELLELQEFLLAQVPSPDQEPIRQHLEECERCVVLVNALKEDRRRSARTPQPAAPTPAAAVATAVIGPLRKPSRASLAAASAGPVTLTPSAPQPSPTPPAVPATTTAPERDNAEQTQALIAALAPAQEPDELGRLGSYRILKVLGSGATGVVFQAQDLHLRRTVALKAMKFSRDDDDTSRQRFLREARAAAALEHEHVVTIYQVGEDRGIPYLAMQMLQGETLDSRIKREGRLPIPEVLRIGREIAEGLAAAYDRGLIHRDIKPANIWLETVRPTAAGERKPGAGGRVKIVDFGLARGAVEDQQLTRTGTILGTPAYMAPEQARAGPVDHRTDLFSLGGVLYRLCTGALPFQADDTMGMLLAVARDQPKPILSLNPDVPQPLVGLILRLLAKHPDGRPATAAEVVSILSDIEQMQTVRPPVPQEETAHARRKPAQSGKGLQVVLVALVALVTFALVWFWSDVRRYVNNQGVVVIAADDPNLKVTIKKQGQPVLERTSLREIELPAGDYEIELVKGSKVNRLSRTQFTVRRGQRLDIRGTIDRRTG
jgi:serine/threonine protein kinase